MTVLCLRRWLITVFFVGGIGFAEDSQRANEIQHTLASTSLEEERPITVHLPESYFEESADSYVVLYVLDGQNRTQHTKYIASYLHDRRAIPELIVVSIPHTGQRNRDYLAFDKESGAENPGVSRFSAFLAEELIPFVEHKYRCKPHRMILGHSTAGAFVVHTLISHPKLFKTRFAFSPSLHHVPGLVPSLETYLQSRPALEGYFYGNIGQREFKPIHEQFSQLRRLLQQHAPESLILSLQSFENDGHATTPFIGVYSALKARFAPLQLTLKTFEEMAKKGAVTAYYTKQSTSFGFEIKPTSRELESFWRYFYFWQNDLETARHALFLYEHYHRDAIDPDNLAFMKTLDQSKGNSAANTENLKPESNFLNKLGYQFVRHDRLDEALVIFQHNAKLYPNIANVHDSLGEVWEKKGLLEKATACYEKAITIARKTKDPNLRFFKSNLQRLSGRSGN